MDELKLFIPATLRHSFDKGNQPTSHLNANSVTCLKCASPYKECACENKFIRIFFVLILVNLSRRRIVLPHTAP